MSLQFPPCPPSLKAIQHYLKTACEHDGRDPVISYWCRLYALQSALKIDRKSDEAKILLKAIMDWLEKEKKRLSENEAITNDIAAQAHIENYALKLFLWADTQDRSSVFNKNVVKAFYTAGMLMDVLSTFGEVSEEITNNCKYAKWKAAYIHNCLKNGETPLPGPMSGENEDFGAVGGETNDPVPRQPSPRPNIGFDLPQVPHGAAESRGGGVYNVPHPGNLDFPTPPVSGGYFPSVPTPTPAPTPTPTPTPQSTPQPFINSMPYNSVVNNIGEISTNNGSQGGSSSGKLSPEQITKAQKYCKWAGSALNYDDVPEAIANLRKALRLLETGEDS